MRDALIFDLDGTLWDSTGVIRPVWNRVLSSHGEQTLSEGEFQSMMGLTKAEIARRVLPRLSGEAGLRIVDECFAAEQAELRAVGGRLYPRLGETLRLLKERCFLAIVSNCAPGYLDAFFEAHGLRYLFDDWETHGGTGLSKAENIRLIVQRNGLSRAWYVGDTRSDAEAADGAGLPFIHAAYGFGEVPEAGLRIERIEELPALLCQLEGRENQCL